jgi:hypothetical protein
MLVTMKVLSIDVDSSERDPSVYQSPNDYTVRLNRRLYGVTKITLTAARIPNCTLLIGDSNNTLIVDDVSYTIATGTYTNGTDLASNVQTALIGSNITSVVFNQSVNTLTFSGSSSFTIQFPWGASPASVLGFSGSTVTGTSVTSGQIDLKGPSSIFLRLTAGADDLDKELFINGGTFTLGNFGGLGQTYPQIPPHYIGRIILGNLGETHIYSDNIDAPLSYNVPNLNMDELRIRMYWNNGTKLVPYDFGQKNHILKFEITCETDRFNKVYDVEPSVNELPPPVDLETPLEPLRLSNNYIYIGIAIILFLGLWVLLNGQQSPHTPGPVV